MITWKQIFFNFLVLVGLVVLGLVLYESRFFRTITGAEWLLFGIFFMLVLIYFKLVDILHHVVQIQNKTED